jgi:acyl carrier protein
VNDTEQAIKELIIEALNLEDLSTDDIETEAPLFGEGLGLDSIDALELGVAIRRKYGVNLDIDSEEIRGHFESVASLARFVGANGE